MYPLSQGTMVGWIYQGGQAMVSKYNVKHNSGSSYEGQTAKSTDSEKGRLLPITQSLMGSKMENFLEH